jgi:hypothetical protein
MSENSPEYLRGYEDGKGDVADQLADVLRGHIRTIGNDADDVNLLTSGHAREIFAAVFGLEAADEEFGPDSIVKHLGHGGAGLRVVQ